MKKRPTRAELRARITEALVRDVGVSERMAQPFVESILGCFAGERQYFPARERNYPVLQIKAALENGTSVRQVIREFDVSRSMLHKLFPGGLPMPRKSAESTVLPKV